MQRVHFQVRIGVFNCQQILTKMSFVVFCWDAATISSNAERLITLKYHVSVSLIWWNFTLRKWNRQGVFITPIQPKKSKSLFELINLIQIKESVVVTLPIFSFVFTYFPLRFWYVLKQGKPGILWVRCPFSTRGGWVQPICHVLLTHYKTYIGGRSYSSTTDNLSDFCTNKTD